MSTWTVHSSPLGQKIWTRECGVSEELCVWAGLLGGYSDAAQHVQVDVALPYLYIMDHNNVERAWLALKRRYPLLAARTVIGENDRVYFHVREEQVASIQPREVAFGTMESEAQMTSKIEEYLNGPRKLTLDLMGNLEVFSVPRGGYWSQSYWHRYHVFINTAHCVADGAANINLCKIFFAMLTSPQQSETIESIGDRLGMVLSSEAMSFNPNLSVARKRWHKAIAYALLQVREGCIRGGQTLPSKATSLTQVTPALSRCYGANLSQAASKRVLAGCRRHGITLGNAIFVLSQVAFAKVLHRRRPNMSTDEWEHRIREPMHWTGPVNIRTKMDPTWQSRGGLTELFNCISLFCTTLPRLPSSEKAEPSYHDLLSRSAFLYRCRFAQAQHNQYLKHPYVLQMSALRFPSWVETTRRSAKLLMKYGRPDGVLEIDRVPKEELPPLAENNSAPVLTCYTASFGSIDGGNLPKMYPISHPLDLDLEMPPVQLMIREHQAYLRAQPGMLYLTPMGRFDYLWMGCWWDGNTYEDAMIKEWVDEVAAATQFYLGGDGIGYDFGLARL